MARSSSAKAQVATPEICPSVAAKLVNGPWCKKNRWAPCYLVLASGPQRSWALVHRTTCTTCMAATAAPGSTSQN